MKFRWLIRVGASLSLSLALVLPAKANTVYVAPDGTGDGSSWGDPAADCSREPGPNGRRVNLGAYGNTPWATRSGPAPMMILVR